MAIYADMEPWGHGFYVYGECSAWDLIHDFLQRCHQTLGAGQFATAIGGFQNIVVLNSEIWGRRTARRAESRPTK